MGTRGAIGFIYEGSWYVSYNHWDSYPEGLGMDVLNFCKETDLTKLPEKLFYVEMVGEDSKPSKKVQKDYRQFADLGVGDQTLDSWYCLLRELQGVGILEAVRDGKLFHMIDNHMFLADSLFCEWAYIIDLDDWKLRVYKGFNKEPLTEKTVLPPDIERDKCDDMGYYPVRMLHAYSLDRLPEFMLGVTNKFKAWYRENKTQKES